jgi:carboxypeptidase T
MFIAYKILTSTDAIMFLNSTEIYISPMQNPDGYEFTRTKGMFSNHRLWRKNRRINKDLSVGVDLNRNWDEHFGYLILLILFRLVGSSQFGFSETYHGPKPFSEPEV